MVHSMALILWIICALLSEAIMNTAIHKNSTWLEVFRLITPILVTVSIVILSQIWNELQDVSKEQARRTVIVEQAWHHVNDDDKHK